MPAIKFKSLDIQGFKSFDQPQSFSIDDLKSGFYFITGENQAEPKLGANGAGKSTIWDALCWVLFEKTPDNLKAGHIHSWNSKQKTRVPLYFSVDKTDYILTRTWNPNTLMLSEDGEAAVAITNDDVVNLIGCNFDSFLYSVLISQFSSKFFDLKPADKMDIFASVMDNTLSSWMDLSNNSKQRKNDLQGQLATSEQSLHNTEGQIVALEGQDYSEQIEEWEAEHDDLLDGLEEAIKKEEKELATLKKSSGKHDKELDTIAEKLEGLDLKWEDSEEKVEKLLRSRKESQSTRADIEAELRLADSNKKALSGLEGDCPTCLQPITGAHLKKEVKKIDKEIAELKSELEDVAIILEDKAGKVKEQEDISYRHDEKIKKLRSDKQEIELENRNLERQINSLEDSLDKKDAQLEKEEAKENPYEKMDSERLNKIVKLMERKGEITGALEKVKADYSLYDYWVKGFKDIRFMVLSEALTGLEIQINNNVQKLGLTDWEIVLAVDSETKKGTVKKGFSVLVKSPTNKEPVPFECWSGGEGQRLRLAGTLGMMDFISDRMGFTSNIEVWDEPTQYLSEAGIEDLLAVLQDRTEGSSKKLFIIDHRDFHTFGGFDGFIKVIKDEEGTTIQVD